MTMTTIDRMKAEILAHIDPREAGRALAAGDLTQQVLRAERWRRAARALNEMLDNAAIAAILHAPARESPAPRT